MTSEQNSEVWAGMPWQVKALGILGLPTIAAVAFAWVIIVDVRTNQRSMLEQQGITIRALEKHGDAMEIGQIETQRMLRALCLNGAISERAAQNCEDPWSARWPRERSEQQPRPSDRTTTRKMFDR